MACSVIWQARRTQAIWSMVLTSFAAPTTAAASTGAPPGNSAAPARRIAPVNSSTATVAPAGTRPAKIFANSATPLVEFG